jgi:signal transduction histidine kinase/CheY-like chemotaxis protein
MFNRHISLPVCLGAALSALILLLAVVLAGTLGEVARHEIASLAASHLENASRQMARELSAGMDLFSRDLQDLASREMLRNPAASPAEVRTALDQFVAGRPEFAFIGLADARSGMVLHASGGLFEGSTLDRAMVESGSKQLFVGDVHAEARLAERVPRSPLGEQARFVDIAAPVRNERGQVSHVLAAHVNWQWVGTLRNSVLGPVMERRGIELLVVDRDNKVLFAPSSVPLGAMLDQLARRAPNAGAKTMPWSDGPDYLTVMTPTAPRGQFQGLGWKVVARQPARVSFAPITAIQRGFFAGALALGLVAAAIAWFAARRLLDPAQRSGTQAPGARLSALIGPPVYFGKRAGESSAPGASAAVGDLLQRLAKDSHTLTPDALTREMEFVTLAESLPHIVWQSDAQGLIEYCNAQWQATFGPAAISRIDQLASLVHQGDLLTFMDAWSASRAGGSDFHCLLRLRSYRDNAYAWFRLRGRALRPNGERPTRWVGTITSVHDAIQQSERTELALERERLARTEADRIALMSDEFLATLSHELRTPLNAIAGWAELLAHRASEDETVARAAEVINRNVQLQAGLLNDLFDTSAIISGKVVLQSRPFDAAASLADVALSQKPAAEHKGVRFECKTASPLPIAGDERRINQAVTNLVSNAIKFTDAGGHVTLDAMLEGESLLISVSDNGCGIAPQFVPHVFERFRQDNAAIPHPRGGFGLGLAIAARLVRLHGGTIEAHSAGLGQGSRFTIRLPALAEASDSIVSAGTEQLLQQFPMTPLVGLRILVTDDEEDARLATQSLLTSFGATVTVSASGSETLRLLDRQGFDLLLCDIGMPGMDGHELIRAIRKRARDKGAMTPAIALTAFAMTRDERASSLAGFDAHVAKPLSAQRLIETICSVCEVGNTH